MAQNNIERLIGTLSSNCSNDTSLMVPYNGPISNCDQETPCYDQSTNLYCGSAKPTIFHRCDDVFCSNKIPLGCYLQNHKCSSNPNHHLHGKSKNRLNINDEMDKYHKASTNYKKNKYNYHNLMSNYKSDIEKALKQNNDAKFDALAVKGLGPSDRLLLHQLTHNEHAYNQYLERFYNYTAIL